MPLNLPLTMPSRCTGYDFVLTIMATTVPTYHAHSSCTLLIRIPSRSVGSVLKAMESNMPT